MKRKWFLIETTGLFAADQLLKTYAEQNLDKKEERRLAGPAVLRRVHNKGMCMGVLDKKTGGGAGTVACCGSHSDSGTGGLADPPERVLEKEWILPAGRRCLEQHV